MTNLYREFARLFAPDPLLAGEVVATSDVDVTVELPDGSLIKARGAATVGDMVFVRGGAVEGPAPAVASVTVIEI